MGLEGDGVGGGGGWGAAGWVEQTFKAQRVVFCHQ